MRVILFVAIVLTECLPALVTAAQAPLAEADGLFVEAAAVLPWELEVQSDEEADSSSMAKVPECRASRILVLRTDEPVSETAAGPVFLELSLTALQFDSEEHARFALESALDGVDPDTGLSYAWDLLVAAESELYLVHAPCLLEERRWEELAAHFVELLTDSGSEPITARCRCGAGCRRPE